MAEKQEYVQLAINQFKRLTDIPEGLTERLIRDTKLLKQPKMSYLEYQQDDDGYLCYLLRGVACSTLFDEEKSKERPLLLWKQGDLLFQPASFLERKPLHESIRLWDDSILLSIPYFRLYPLLEDYRALYPLLFRLYGLREQRLARYNTILAYTATERIAYLLRHYPGIETRVKQELLAEYLHMDRRTFSILLKQAKNTL